MKTINPDDKIKQTCYFRNQKGIFQDTKITNITCLLFRLQEQTAFFMESVLNTLNPYKEVSLLYYINCMKHMNYSHCLALGVSTPHLALRENLTGFQSNFIF